MAVPSHEKMDTRIAIIGAGIAGLSAAAHLIRNGLENVILLEASDRIGGRMHTKEFGGDGKIVELGANWIHGAALTNSVFRLATQHKLLDPFIMLNRVQGYVYTSDGRAIRSDLTDKVFKLFLQWEDEEGEDPKNCPSNSEIYYRNRLKKALSSFDERDHGEVKCVLNALLNYEQFHMGDHLHFLTSKDTGYVEIPGGNVKVPKGMISILNSLCETLAENVKLRQEVWKVTRKENEVEIKCKSGEKYNVDHVICTCSLGVLKANHTNMFEPELPSEKVQAIQQIGFGRVNKIFLKYAKPFWQEGKGGVYLGWKDSELSDKMDKWYKNIFGFDEVLNNPSVLVAWVSGQGAEDMEKLSNQEVKRTCTDLLRQFLKDPSVPLPVDILRSSWVSNPLTRGSYSYWNHDTQQDSYPNLSAPVYNSSGCPQLCFAGEATDSDGYSTMHGGRSSGLREAERLLKFYNIVPKDDSKPPNSSLSKL